MSPSTDRADGRRACMATLNSWGSTTRDRIRLGEASQIIEIRILMKLELRIITPRYLVCGWENGDGIIFHLVDESF